MRAPKPQRPYGPRKALDLEIFKYPPQPHYPLHQACCDYTHERLYRKGQG